jgi:septum formation protein
MTVLVLASASGTRAGLLRHCGVPFEVRPAHVDEDMVRESMLGDGAEARAVADALAELKALRVSSSDPDALVLGADQVLVCEGMVFSKAETMDTAREQLQRLRGRRHQLVTAAVLAKGAAPIWRHVDISTLWMRDVSDGFLESYLGTEGDALLGSVGCYRLEAMGSQLFERIEGDYFSILGLPLVPLLAALRQQGVVEA